MASTTAMFTGLSGLNANSRNLDVIGNNIANVNTTAFKGARMMFSNVFSRTLGLGSPPSAESGGANPTQVGLGVGIAGTQRDFRGGSISTTGDSRDLAIEGDGFFIVDRAGSRFFTRAGSFRPNAANELVTISGERVMGFGVDHDFNVVPGALAPVTIPVGTMTLAQATRNLRFTGNLNAAGDLPTRGSLIQLDALSTISGTPLSAATPLADLQLAAAPGAPLLAPGQNFQIDGATKGSKRLPPASLPVTAATSVADLLTFLNQALGIQTTAGANPDGRAPGAALDPATGVISITGNTGTASDLAIDAAHLRVADAAGTVLARPLTPAKSVTADGESVRTTFVAYDSLGTPITMDLTMVLESRGDAGTTWRYLAESGDDSDTDIILGSGQLSFDTSGQPAGATTATVRVDRAGTGAASPQNLSFVFDSPSDRLTALADVGSAMAATFQDGSPLGTLANAAVGVDGLITGAFTNGLTRTLGQVALATFANPEGLVDAGGNLFTSGAASGTAAITAPLSLGAGRVLGGALELSNVDLSQEFINMILASTGYSAASRVITTTDQLMQQLLVLGR
ncbi:MAG TPA: flagellar hook-basal body complex protein [Phycisphaerales bacterium]|nr:flagellar hook-basal body complex protein [Phycisphaerales bacterium]